MTYTGLTSLGENGNVFWNGFANTPNGIQWNQFKFAIKLQYIIDGIEAQFPEITFSSSFFGQYVLKIAQMVVICLHPESHTELSECINILKSIFF